MTMGSLCLLFMSMAVRTDSTIFVLLYLGSEDSNQTVENSRAGTVYPTEHMSSTPF